jgi:hypothetical protein
MSEAELESRKGQDLGDEEVPPLDSSGESDAVVRPAMSDLAGEGERPSTSEDASAPVPPISDASEATARSGTTPHAGDMEGSGNQVELATKEGGHEA